MSIPIHIPMPIPMHERSERPETGPVPTGLAPAAPVCVDFWLRLRKEASDLMASDAWLAPWVHDQVLRHGSFTESFAHVLAGRLDGCGVDPHGFQQMLIDVIATMGEVTEHTMADVVGATDRDPACAGLLDAYLNYKGIHALMSHRVAHALWNQGLRPRARWLQSRCAQRLGVDIHPAARIGKGILLDHATGLVIGETAVVEDAVSILHNVTLGGTGKQTGLRHPTVRAGVLIGAGSQILGNVEIGRGAKVGAGSVVMRTVPAHVTVAGVLARVVGVPGSAQPALEMDQEIPSTLSLLAEHLPSGDVH